jgi:serine/threonine-protein kinase 31
MFTFFLFPVFLNRHINISIRFGNDLSDAMQVLDEGSFTTLASLNELEKIWAEYNVAQEKIQTCLNEVG